MIAEIINNKLLYCMKISRSL